MRFGKKGSNDILGVLPGGRFLAVECKAKGGRLSPEQKQFLANVQELGGLAVVVRGWQELDEALTEAGYAMKETTPRRMAGLNKNPQEKREEIGHGKNNFERRRNH